MLGEQAGSGGGQHYWAAATGCEFQINLFGFGLLSKRWKKQENFFSLEKATHARAGLPLCSELIIKWANNNNPLIKLWRPPSAIQQIIFPSTNRLGLETSQPSR
jgi:hypothetical protein